MSFFFKQKTAYEMRISDWSSDVCSSDLPDIVGRMDLDAVEKIAPLDLGNIGMRPGAGGADNRLRGKPPLVRHDCKTIACQFDGFHPYWPIDGEFETGLIPNTVIQDVIARGIPLMRGRRHKPTRQRTVSGGGKQAQGIPPMAPCTTGPSFGVEDHEIGPSTTQIIAQRQPHLAATDDDDVALRDHQACRQR